MKKIIFTYCLSILFLLSFSCKKKPDSVINFSLSSQTSRNISLSTLTDEIQYISLSNDKLLGRISKVKYAKNNFYIIDFNSILFKFNGNGKFETQIGRKGRGPGEYQFITDFIVGENTDIVCCLISYQKEIFEYSTSGEYIKAISLPFRTSKIAGYNDRFLTFNNISSGNNSISFVLLDLEGNILSQFTNKYKFNNDVGRTVRFEGECLFYNFQGNLHLKEIYSDTVFYIENMSMVKKYILNTGKSRFTTEIRKNIINGVAQNAIIQSNIFETTDYLFFYYNNQILVYNKKTNDSYEISKNEGFINDVDGGPNVVFKSVINDNILLTWFDAYELKQYVESDAFKNSTPKFPEKKKQLEQLANSLDENDNPVLMLVKLKE